MTAVARKLAPAPQVVASKHVSAPAFLAEGLKRVDARGLLEADREYGDDFERELADLAAGRHVLQRHGTPPR